MAANIYPDFPPNLQDAQTQFLLSEIKNWSIHNGLAIRPPQTYVPKAVDDSQSLATTAPVTLFPSLFPRSCFEEARGIQCAYNELYAAIARDEGWLREVVEDLVDVDEFIAKLWRVHLTIKEEGYAQPLSLGIFRSDYMVHNDLSDQASKVELRQVEFNTIASSFGGLSAKVTALHRHLADTSAYPESTSDIFKSTSLPHNPSIEAIADGLHLAHRAYGSSKSDPALPLCILFVVQDPENNVFDQYAISAHLQEQCRIPVFRLLFPLTLVHTNLSPERNLVYRPPHSPSTAYEVTTLYYRAGYAPSEYTTPSAWDARLHLERSAAIKCPSILTHLAGSKKIQQILATPASPYLDRFLAGTPYEPFIDRVRATFAAIYPLDDSEAGKQAIGIARNEQKAKGYVLKPQREGGGNNIYGEKIPSFLGSLGNDEKKYRSHILMELIEPPSLRNTILRNGEVKSGEVIGELGVYGVCLWKSNEQGDDKAKAHILENYEAGFLLRTKGRESEEGGVAAGFGAVDSPCLVDV